MTNETQELLAAYAEYVKLLEDWSSSLAALAYEHGITASEATMNRGLELRQRIAELMPADLDAPPPQSKLFRRGIEEGEFEE